MAREKGNPISVLCSNVVYISLFTELENDGDEFG